MLCADALELLRIRNKGGALLPVPQRARPAEQRSRSCMRELRNFEIEERAPVARPAPTHAGPAQASLQDAEGQDLEILVVRARFLAGKAAAALLLCERTLPGRAVAHSIFRHMNDEDGTLRRLTPGMSRARERGGSMPMLDAARTTGHCSRTAPTRSPLLGQDRILSMWLVATEHIFRKPSRLFPHPPSFALQARRRPS